ncbi:uncharacterized protein LOC113516637 [Galleria mellonella]|uniref:Uncharacterized protein LOC113516637 n=1 Tax=Galleria mellonella TaxID=7137 RepID=A0A6J1WPD8_GALME|nr:uncharacterized protein LOC113516637 [Galleria mellonella]
MFKIYSKSNPYVYGKYYFSGLFYAGGSRLDKTMHVSSALKFPQVAIKLPINIEDINSSEMGRFSPQRDRDISAPVICYHYEKQNQNFSKIDITSQPDPHVNKYDCRGAVSLSSTMQSNVPTPFSGNHTHLNMPGSQWGQGIKYLSDHLQSAHYLTLRNEYRNASSAAVTFATRNMCTEVNRPLSAKEKLKQAMKEYGSTVIVFHISISLLSLGGCYLLISSGVDLMAVLKYFNIGEGALSKVASSNAGTFVIAYAVHKSFAPVRIAITLTATPFIVRYLRNIGFIKRNVSSGGGK